MAQNADFELENRLRHELERAELEMELFGGDDDSFFPGADAPETSSPGSAASPQTPSSGVSQQGQADSQPAQSAPPQPPGKVTGGLALPAQALPKPPPPPPPAVARDSMSPPKSSYGLGMVDEQPADGLIDPAVLSLNREGDLPLRHAPAPAAPAPPAAEIAQHDPPLFQGGFAEKEGIVDMPLGFPAPAPPSPAAPENPPAQQPPRRRARAPKPAPAPLPPPNYALQLGNPAPHPDYLDALVSAGRWGRWDPKRLCQGHYILTSRSPYDPNCPQDVRNYMDAVHVAVHAGWAGKVGGPTMAAANWFSRAQEQLHGAIVAKCGQHAQGLRQGRFPQWMIQGGIDMTLLQLRDGDLLGKKYARNVVGRCFKMLDLFMEAETGMRGNGTNAAPYVIPE